MCGRCGFLRRAKTPAFLGAGSAGASVAVSNGLSLDAGCERASVGVEVASTGMAGDGSVEDRSWDESGVDALDLSLPKRGMIVSGGMKRYRMEGLTNGIGSDDGH